MQKFTAELLPVPGMNATYVNIPFSVKKVFSTDGQVKIKATIDGAAYRGIISRMEKNAPHILIITQAVRSSIGKAAGDKIKITLEEDKEERIVEIPHDLQLLLDKNKSAQQFFSSLSYTNRKEYVRWIESAKRSETRSNRLTQTLEKLKAKLKNPTEIK